MMFLGVNTKENPMIFCGKSLAAQMEPARTLAGVFPGLFTTKAFPSQLKYSMWKWNAVGENRRSKILTSFGRCSQCGVGWNSYLKIYLVCVWGDIVWMRIGPKCMSIFGKNGGKRILETKSIHPANPLVFASHTLPMGMKGKPQEKQLSWSRVFSLPSAGWGLTTPPCLGFWLELVRNIFFPSSYSHLIFKKVGMQKGFCWTPKSVLIFANVRSSFCSRFLFTCISSACFAGETTLRQINENWCAQMVDLYENGFEACPSQNFVYS